ncbi:MAG TPA: nuclear transport factor 2 family protein [Candidatus Didemnitutus sp.]
MHIRFRVFFALLLVVTGGSRLCAGGETAFIRDYYDAFTARDAGRLASFYAPAASLDDPSFGLALRGADQIRALFTSALAKYESLEWSIEHATISGATTIVEGIMTGKLGGHTVRIHFVSVFAFADGRIVAQRDLYDVLHFYSQLGVVPGEFRPARKPSS